MTPNDPLPSRDAERLRRLYTHHGPALLRYALRRCPTPEDANDVVSEVFVVAARRIDDVPSGAEAPLWLYGTARRVLANQRRSARRRSRLGEALRTQVVAEAADTAHLVVQREQDRSLHEALRLLSDADRDLLALIAWEGLTPSQAATVLGTPPAVVRVRLHRARARLRRALERVERSPAPATPSHLVAPAMEEL